MRHTHVGVKAALATLAVLLLAACNRGDGGRDAQRPATTTSAGPTTTPSTAPTTTTAPPLPAASPGVCPAVPPRAEPDSRRPRYHLDVNVDLANNRVTGTTRVLFTADAPTDRLVFRLWANAPRTAKAGAVLSVTAVRVEGNKASVPFQQPDATTVVVPHAVSPGAPTAVEADFALALPGPVPDRISRTGDAVRLGSFFPILAWEPGVGWATEPATAAYAEASLSTAADFTASIKTPPGLDVIATGTEVNGEWQATGVPDFAVSIGRFAKRATATTKSGTAVTVAVDSQVNEDPNDYLRRIVASLDDFHTRFGPYPWPTYTLAIQPNLSGGIEYPMHVMQGPRSIGRTTPHEVAHMWFYGLVGSNQGRAPFLDEGLATWAEARFENTVDRFAGYTIPAPGRGQAGQPMTYWASRQSAYYRSVYVQPVQALAALGPPHLVDCALRLYVARNAYRVATPKDLLDALHVVFPDAAAVMARFGIKA